MTGSRMRGPGLCIACASAPRATGSLACQACDAARERRSMQRVTCGHQHDPDCFAATRPHTGQLTRILVCGDTEI
jgi:hypothetical protein